MVIYTFTPHAHNLENNIKNDFNNWMNLNEVNYKNIQQWNVNMKQYIKDALIPHSHKK